ncbi:MAG: acetyl-CoA carboxylase biotin carboxyl carrier protein subunit [Crocinitomicaceae bacterium]|nr:acetyl-CoA carboxylase biotin carboxyl carrier protein subunit [Crocinitomicaceae bacterium]
MIHATVNGKTFDIELRGREIRINDSEVLPDIYRIDDKTLHLLWNNRSYTAEVCDIHSDTKEVKIKVNGNIYTVLLKDRFDVLLKNLGLDSGTAKKQKEVKAPMPGMVLNVLVAEGDSVDKETPLVILEAMKMENVIKSPAPGKVKRLGVNQGQAVEKNAILIEFD